MKIDTTYRKEGQDDRTIEVIVFYINEEPKDGMTRSKYPTVYIIVRNDTTTGIGSDEVDTGKDELSIPPRRGMAAKWMRVTKILNENSGFLRLEVK